MEIKFNYTGGIINLPAITDVLLCSYDAETLRVIITLASVNIAACSDLDVLLTEISNRTQMRQTDVRTILSKLIKDGILAADESTAALLSPLNEDKTAKLRADDKPIYTGEQVEKLFDVSGGKLKALIDECQNITGKIFNTTEVNRIIAMYDYLGLSGEYIVLLFNYYKGKEKTSVPYIEKVAYSLFDEDIDTVEKLDEYLKNKEEFEGIEGKLKSMFGIGTRSLSKKESEFVRLWTKEYKFDFEMLRIAYDKTVESTKDNRFSFAYMNKILESWHNSGYSKPEQVTIVIRKDVNSGTSYDVNEFSKAAMERSRKQ